MFTKKRIETCKNCKDIYLIHGNDDKHEQHPYLKDYCSWECSEALGYDWEYYQRYRKES